jgi:phenylalanyl-tRNA synthetase alpha subunit
MPSHDIDTIRADLIAKIQASDTPRDILRAPEFKDLYSAIASMPAEERGAYGQKVNQLKQAVEAAVVDRENELESSDIAAIDVSAPWDVNAEKPSRLLISLPAWASERLNRARSTTIITCLAR